MYLLGKDSALKPGVIAEESGKSKSLGISILRWKRQSQGRCLGPAHQADGVGQRWAALFAVAATDRWQLSVHGTTDLNNFLMMHTSYTDRYISFEHHIQPTIYHGHYKLAYR